MYKKTIIATALVLMFFTPLVSQAASLTESQINAVLGLLQSFNVDATTLANVTAALKGQPTTNNNAGGVNGSTTPAYLPPGQVGKMMCIDLMRNLNVGSQGEDVRKLQELLATDPDAGFTGSSTGYYGPRTLEAMKRFQMKHEIASSSTGFVGPMTRGFLNRKCGRGLMPRPPFNTIDSISTSTDRAPM
ncbi:MAG: peptidoglycan-binding domain-containing protein [Patescibacteria group bacterium]